METIEQELRNPDIELFSSELASRASELLDGPGVLDVDELQALVCLIADRPDLWKPLVVFDPERRRYKLLYEDDRIDIWVLSWMPGQRTGFHDHDTSGVGLVCVQGELDEGRFVIGADAETLRMTAGTVSGGPGGYIHAVAHAAGRPAVSIHAYSPPLERVGQYRCDSDGRLRREPEPGRKELYDETIGAFVGATEEPRG